MVGFVRRPHQEYSQPIRSNTTSSKSTTFNGILHKVYSANCFYESHTDGRVCMVAEDLRDYTWLERSETTPAGFLWRALGAVRHALELSFEIQPDGYRGICEKYFIVARTPRFHVTNLTLTKTTNSLVVPVRRKEILVLPGLASSISIQDGILTCPCRSYNIACHCGACARGKRNGSDI
jgi:hypothetical protein